MLNTGKAIHKMLSLLSEAEGKQVIMLWLCRWADRWWERGKNPGCCETLEQHSLGGQRELLWGSVTQKKPTGPSWNRFPTPMSSTYHLSVENFSLLGLLWIPKTKFNQRSEKNAERKENRQARQNNSPAIKQSQGLLVQGLWIIFWAMSFELLCRCWNP